MYIPFEELSAESRVWIYQGSRPFTSHEVELVNKALTVFCEQWNAHGQALKSSFRIEKNQFVIMSVDEDFHNPSGCSIDSSVGVLRQIQSATGIDFLDRSKASFYLDDKVTLIPLTELKSGFSSGRLQASSITFNTLAATKSEWEAKWQLPAEKSWMAKYLSKAALAS
ncbi:MAG: hypothetical protein RI909_1933 [Bacteroidota bacterium]|jgi:hypothetical protein